MAAQAQQEDEYEEEFEDELEDLDEYEEYEEEIDADGEEEEAIGGDLLGGTAGAAAAAPGDEDEIEDDDEVEDDEDEDDDDAEEEEEDDDDLVAAQDWAGLRTLAERDAILSEFARLADGAAARGDGDVGAPPRQLTVLLLGKGGVGKSSLVNALLGERAAAVSAFKLQADTESTVRFVRQVALGGAGGDEEGFRLTLIDTCGLEDPEAGDAVSYGALQRIAEDVKGTPIDAVLLVDRLDLYRVEPLDKRIFAAITDQFGRGIWQKTVLALTHGQLPLPPPGTSYETFAERRIALLRRAVRGRRLLAPPPLPAVIVENSDTCKLDASRARVLPDGTRWVDALMAEVVDAALRGKPYVWRPRLARRPAGGLKWLVPVVAYAQFLAWKALLQPALRRDEDRQAAADEEVWREKAAERRRLGIGPPLRPTQENAWRLEQMYDDD